jgi:dipeptidyl aminopeptidase/acylaminoacyl peptidase
MCAAVRPAILTASLSLISASVLAAPQPLEDFARMPQIRAVSMSMDGRHVAFISAIGDVSVLMTFDRRSKSSEFRQVAGSEPGKFDLKWCKWANNERLLCAVSGNIRGKKYAEPPYSRLIGVNADGSDLRVLQLRPDKGNMVVAKTTMKNFRFNQAATLDGGGKIENAPNENQRDVTTLDGHSSTKPVAFYNPEQQDGLIDITPDDHENVLIEVDDDRDSYPTVFNLNIYSGQRGVILNENPPINNFTTDGRGNIRLGWGTTENLNTLFYARLEDEREWRALSKVEAFTSTDALRPISVAPWKNSAYAVGDYQGRDALWAIDLTETEPPRLLFNHPLVDVGEPLLTADKRLLGIRYDVERPYAYYETETGRSLIDRLQKQFPNKFHHIVDSNESEKTFIVQSSSDVDEGTFFLFDTDEDRLMRLGTAYPELQQESLGHMTYITYKASDGTEIPGYLTVPTGVRSEKLPLVVLPHDGPLQRDSWRFSFLRTFVASRGYAVLQMNYRGSSGYGQAWRLAAHQDWGGLAYSDIVDATRWAISEGIADPKRVCIAGWGFGGYTALLGAVRNDDLYRCSISIGGFSDLELLREHASVHRDAPYRREQIGSQRDKLKKDSPLQHVDQISVPILMVHGDKDWEVQVDQTKAMAKALKRAKKPHKAVIIEDAHHDLARRSDRVTLLKEVEAFLSEHLGKGAQPSAQQTSS